MKRDHVKKRNGHLSEKNVLTKLKDRYYQDKKKNIIKKMEESLEVSRFKQLNEHICSSKSNQCYNFFKNNVDLFKKYQKGYLDSMKQWKGNKPLDIIISWLKKKDENLLVADYGCGKAILAQSVPQVL